MRKRLYLYTGIFCYEIEISNQVMCGDYRWKTNDGWCKYFYSSFVWIYYEYIIIYRIVDNLWRTFLCWMNRKADISFKII